MRMIELIEKKKNGVELSDGEIAYFVEGYTKGEIPDYQAAALCMAIRFRGMSGRERAVLTDRMMRSGSTVDLSSLPHTVDKHSTGGVGDLTSLVVAPLAASCGLTMAKMSGRGLGHTGGTVDKLESIPGFRTALSEEEFLSQAKRIGMVLVGQTANLAPADKKLYALRDVTGTVDSLPLIASSIMSKKLAAGAESIVLDVKYGSGAFMKTEEDARALAEAMVDIGRANGRKMAALVTSMEFPLAPQIGNTLEVEEAVKILRGEDPAGWGVREVILRLTASLLSLSLGMDGDGAAKKAEDTLVSGAGYKKFLEWIAAQGGDVSYIEENRLERAPIKKVIVSPASGWLARMDTEAVGTAACLLGAGRMKLGDQPDLTAGIVLTCTPGGKLEKDQPIAEFYTSDEKKLADAEAVFLGSLGISEEKPVLPKLIAGSVR